MPYKRNKNRLARHRTQTQKRRLQQKAEVISVLGEVCSHCGFSDSRALVIDHVNDDGYLERREIRKDYEKYMRKVATDTTGRYQLLCANCNLIKEYERRQRNLLPRYEEGIARDTILRVDEESTHKVEENECQILM